jgi:hypothetical protein
VHEDVAAILRTCRRLLPLVADGEVAVDSIELVGVAVDHAGGLVDVLADVVEVVLAARGLDDLAEHHMPVLLYYRVVPGSKARGSETAVNIVFMEPRLKLMSMVFFAPKSLFASPNAAWQRGLPPPRASLWLRRRRGSPVVRRSP